MTNNGVRLTQEELLKNLAPPSKKGAPAQQEPSLSLDEIDSFGDRESLLEMFKDINSYQLMLNESITLINDSLTSVVPFTRENLYLFCAFTGSGKSTVAANISFPLWKQGKKVLVISNEESKQDVLFRVACLELGLNFNDYKKGRMPQDQILRVMSFFPQIAEFVKVLDVNYKDGLMNKIEGVKKALEAVRTSDYACVLIDYYQLIQGSLKDPSKTRYDNLNDLRLWLGQYIKSSNVPVALFVQLYSLGKKGGVKDIDARIKECSAIVEPATVIIEVVPNFDIKTSDFIIHKDRFGFAGHRVTCAFEHGRFIHATPDEIAELEKKAKHNKASKALDQMVRRIGSEEEDD